MIAVNDVGTSDWRCYRLSDLEDWAVYRVVAMDAFGEGSAVIAVGAASNAARVSDPLLSPWGGI